MRLLCAAVALFAISAPAHAGVEPSLLETIKKVKPADYPSANTVSVVSSQAVVFQPDGQFTNTFRSVRLVLTNAGKTEAASTSLYYTKDAEKMELISAQLIKPDGKVVPIAKSDITDTEQSGEMNIYDPNGRAPKITFGGLAVGDAIDVTYKLTRLTPTRPGYFNDQFWFQSTEPVLEASYTIDGPASKPLTTHIYHRNRAPKITESRRRVGDRILYAWSTKGSPQLVPEIAMAMSVEVPALIVTTDPSWKNFSKWWAELAAPQMKVTEELKAKVAELTKGKKTKDERIKALFDFVSADIRYRGLGVGPRTGYTPRPAHDTFTSRWGVCRDVSILLSAMLRADGLEAYPVLTNVGDPVRSKIAYEGFNHAIVAMPKQGGGWTFMDPTAKNMHDLLPANEGEQSILVSTPKGEQLGTIPAIDPKANLGKAIATSTIAADGSMTSKVTVEAKGIFDMVLRGVAAAMSPDQQRQTVEQIIKAALPDAELVSYKTSSPLMLSTPMSIEIEIKVPNAVVKTGDHMLLRTLVTSGALGLVEAVMPRVLGGVQQRKYMMDAQVTFQYDQEETITLAPGTKIVAMPNSARADNKISSLAAACTKKDATTLECRRSFALKSRFIQPAQYTQLRGVIANLGRIAHQPVILAGGK
jgi:cellulose synthase operon protein C